MRESSPIEPMWEAEGQDAPPEGPGSGIVRSAARVAGVVARILNPPLHRWLVGKAPALRISWGPKQYELRPDGVLSGRRDGDGWRDNPRSNYNDRFEKRRARGGDGAAAAEQDKAPSSPKATPKAKSRKASGKSAARKRKPAPVPENGGGRPTSGSS